MDLAPKERLEAFRYVLASRNALAIRVVPAREVSPAPRAAPAAIADHGTAARTCDRERIGLRH
jgi:hypothetical protein